MEGNEKQPKAQVYSNTLTSEWKSWERQRRWTWSTNIVESKNNFQKQKKPNRAAIVTRFIWLEIQQHYTTGRELWEQTQFENQSLKQCFGGKISKITLNQWEQIYYTVTWSRLALTTSIVTCKGQQVSSLSARHLQTNKNERVMILIPFLARCTCVWQQKTVCRGASVFGAFFHSQRVSLHTLSLHWSECTRGEREALVPSNPSYQTCTRPTLWGLERLWCDCMSMCTRVLPWQDVLLPDAQPRVSKCMCF